jgi:predicted amidohydrolase
MKFDYLIRNGHVIDTAAGIDGENDIGVLNRKVYLASPGDTSVMPEIDAKGYYVVPGLIDFHTHIFDVGSGLGIHPDFFPATGVTSAVDGGSAGCANYEAFHLTKVVHCKCRIKAQINVSSQGQTQLGFPENYNPKYFKKEKILELKKKYEREIIGLKMRLSKETVGNDGLETFLRTMEIADELRMPVVIHTTNPPISPNEIVRYLRPRDVYCHCYQGEGMTILNENGRVDDAVKKARSRGIMFDACNGTLNFAFSIAKSAIADGFKPDIISSDTSGHSFSLPYYCKNLPFVMSKYLNLGLTMNEVICATTETPAKLMGMEGLIGTLVDGALADITILEKTNRETIYSDKREEYHGDVMLTARFTMINGDVAYCSNDFWL